MYSLFGKDIRSYLNEIYRLVKDIVLDLFNYRDLYCVVIFGSAARYEDFVPGISDIDVLVITKQPPHIRFHEFSEFDIRIHVTSYTLNEFKDIVKMGHPLAFMLKYRVELYGSVSSLLSDLKITEYTRHVLRRSIFAALGLALEYYYSFKEYVRALSHLYHSLRHLIRYKASFKGIIPISDKEVYNSCDSEELKILYRNLVRARRMGVDSIELKRFIYEVIKAITLEFKLKPPDLNRLKELLQYEIATIVAGEDNGYLILRVRVLSKNGEKIFEVRGNDIREVDSLFLP